MLELAVVAALYIGWSIVNGLIAEQKNRNGGRALLLSLICSPLLIWLYLVAVPVAAPLVARTAPRLDAPPQPLRISH